MNLSKIKKIFKWLGISCLVLIVILFLLLNFALPFGESDEELEAYLNAPGIEYKIDYTTVEQSTIRLLYIQKENRTADRTLVFIHGAPGSLSDFKAYLKDPELLAKYNIVVVDRPGYGHSDAGSPIPEIDQQASLILDALIPFELNEIILVGHSYGGPIAVKMSLLAPDEVVGMLLLAPVNEAASEPKYRISYLAVYPPIKWLLPGAIYSAAVEKLAHPSEIEAMKGDWSKIKCKTIHMHGDKDFLAPLSNIKYAQNLIPSEYYELIRFPDENHFLPWTKDSIIKEVLTTRF